jgi:hypothetical protein
MEKRLGAILLGGDQLVSLDNCTHDLGGELLCQLVERPVVKIRVLGLSALKVGFPIRQPGLWLPALNCESGSPARTPPRGPKPSETVA